MIIHTERLLLRRPERGDFDRFYAMLTDPVAREFTGGVTRLGYRERLRLFLEECAADFSPAGAEFAVIKRAGGNYLGYCGFRWSEELGGCEFLFGYSRDSWGKGYATEAAMAALDFLFSAYGHDEYLATVEAGNAASGRVLEKTGFVRAGAHAHAGQSLDLYRLRRSDFEKKRAAPPGQGGS